MSNLIQDLLKDVTQATAVHELEMVQSLWSGYGKIVRYNLEGSSHKTVIVKHIKLPQPKFHPRGWNTDLSHQRKLKSYQVESAWYDTWNSKCSSACRTPACLSIQSTETETLIVLEDLNSSGFPERHSSVSMVELRSCLSWLAQFHACFMQESPKGLWEVGTYWHLNTRPDELNVLEDLPLKAVASQIDRALQESPFQTFVHGDAKLANFCFSENGSKVAAVDFQYVGGGCGMKDVAYFLGSCLNEEECESLEEELLQYYFTTLQNALVDKEIDVQTLEENWRSLYPIAWTDFHRFLKGWSPGHWKINSYSERLAREVIAELQQ